MQMSVKRASGSLTSALRGGSGLGKDVSSDWVGAALATSASEPIKEDPDTGYHTNKARPADHAPRVKRFGLVNVRPFYVRQHFTAAMSTKEDKHRMFVWGRVAMKLQMKTKTRKKQ